jgi:ubiquinone/menaquinone biosynthesis C-methylase UbiE
MKNKDLSLKRISDRISEENIDKQEKNRLWWESLPMTYFDWDVNERVPRTKEDFLMVEKKFLNGNPYMGNKFNFDLFKNKKVLEIGCGSGAASCLFAKAGAKVTAIDITNEAIKITKNNAQLQNLKIKTLRQDAENLIFLDKSFDYIFSWGVLHHSQNTQKTFEEVSRVLKKYGAGLIMVYNKNSLRYYINGLYWLIIKGKIFQGYNLDRVQDFYTDGYYHRHFTPKELKKKLEKTGLICTSIFTTHMGTRFAWFLPKKVEDWLKNHYGWLLVAKFKKK